jgi:cell division protein FtsB
VSTRAVKPPPVALPPIQRVNPDEAVVAKFPVELARPEPLPRGLSFAQQLPDDAELVARAPRRTQPWLWAALLLLAGGVGAIAYHGYTVVTQLEHRLEQADGTNRDQRAELDALKTKTAGIESNVAESSEQIQRVDDRNNMVIQSLITEQSRKTHKSY